MSSVNIQHQRLRISMNRLLIMGVAALSSVQASENYVEFRDVEGDLVGVKREGSTLQLYGNGELLLPRVTSARVDGLVLTLTGLPVGSEESTDAVTKIPPEQESVLTRLQALFAVQESVLRESVLRDTMPVASGEAPMQALPDLMEAKGEEGKAEELPTGTLLSYRDIDGDLVEFKREGGVMNLYGNGDLALNQVYIAKIEGYMLHLRSMQGSSTEETEAESTIPAGPEQDQILARAKALMEQDRARAEAMHNQRAEMVIAALHRMAKQAEVLKEAQVENAERPRRKAGGLQIDIGGKQENTDLAPAVKGETTASSDPYRSVLGLNRFNFNANVLVPGGGDSAENWIVLFCYSWWEPCQKMKEPFAQMGAVWQSDLNKEAVLTRKIRFAQVDCATDRVLCNERGVEGFPHVQYYTGGALVKKWSGGRANDELSLSKWLKKRLEGVAASSPPPKADESETLPSVGLIYAETLAALPAALPWNTASTDLLLILAVLALNMRAICSNLSLYDVEPEPVASDSPSKAGEPEAIGTDAAGPGAGRPLSQPRSSVTGIRPADLARAAQLEL